MMFSKRVTVILRIYYVAYIKRARQECNIMKCSGFAVWCNALMSGVKWSDSRSVSRLLCDLCKRRQLGFYFHACIFPCCRMLARDPYQAAHPLIQYKNNRLLASPIVYSRTLAMMQAANCLPIKITPHIWKEARSTKEQNEAFAKKLIHIHLLETENNK